MAIRTTEPAVRAIIQTDPALSVDPFIATANSIVNWLEGRDDGGVLSADDKEIIERWLAAHFYAHRDQLLQSKATGRASGSFQGQTAMVLNSTQYGQTAMLLDHTGELAKRSKEAETGKIARFQFFWLGTSDDQD